MSDDSDEGDIAEWLQDTGGSVKDAASDIAPFHAYIAAWAVLLLVSGAWLISSVGLLFGVLFALLFIAGAAFIPIMAYTVRGALGPISGALATSVIMAPLLGARRVLLHQTEDDRYEFDKPPDGDEGKYWGRLWFVPVALSWAVSDDAEDYTVREELDELAAEGRTPTGKRYSSGEIERGSGEWYVELPAAADGGLTEEDVVRIPIGQKINEYRGTSGTSLGEEALAQALEKYGGDTAAYGDRTMHALRVVFALMGLGMGWLIFF